MTIFVLRRLCLQQTVAAALDYIVGEVDEQLR